MRQRIHDILWLTIATTTIIFGYYIYKAWTTEYDENVNSLALAILLSVFTLIILIYLVRTDLGKNKLKTFIKYFTLFLGTPIALIYPWVYLTFFQMSFISMGYSTKPNKTYQVEKFRNYFKAQNILVDENLSQNPDTIIGVILRNGIIDQLYRVKRGDTMNLTRTDIEYLTKEQIKALTTY